MVSGRQQVKRYHLLHWLIQQVLGMHLSEQTLTQSYLC
ncbi:hypothetical protein DM860_017666 [Cuscuta australis]|uniref:Uncharacterized protein n=1 Tax=Cuscuta australis TaxID=267555 RepID=A0A328DXC2_9ASTE|nr:hypothetical protein DM860_017666 [Cuscuta australis]